MKINATIVKPDGLYGMVMPEKPNSNLLKTPGTYGGIQWQSYKDSVKFAKDAAVMYEDQQKVMRLLPTHAVTKIISPREYEMTPGVYPLPEPLDCEQIRLFRYKAIGHSLWLGWVESVTEYDLDVKISQETKPETKLVLRISQGTDNKSLDPELSSIKARNKVFAGFGSEGGEPTRKVIAGCRYSKCDCASGDECFEYEKVGVEEKKEPETEPSIGMNAKSYVNYYRKQNPKWIKALQSAIGGGVSEREEPSQSDIDKLNEKIAERYNSGTIEGMSLGEKMTLLWIQEVIKAIKNSEDLDKF